MLMGKRDILVDSVKKLLALRVPENEIIVNLGEIGVSSAQARELINEAKKEPIEEEEEKKLKDDSGSVFMDVAENLAEATESEGEESEGDVVEGISSQFPDEEEGDSKKKRHRAPVIIEKKVAGRIGSFRAKPVKTSIDRLWEKGILTAVNQKLNEMKSIREELDRVMQKNIEQAMQSELERIKVMFESQRSLMVSQMEEKLEDKFREASYLIEQKLIEIKTSKNELVEAAGILEEERKRHKQFMKDYEASMSGLKGSKDAMIAEMNSELIRAKSNAQAVIDTAEAKIKEIDERVSRTLELESSIAEGLMSDAEDKIKEMIDEKSEGVRFELAKTMQGIIALKDEIEKTFKKKIEGIEEERQAVSRKFLEVEIRKIREFRDAFEKQMEERLKKLDRLYSALEKETKAKKNK